MEVRVLVNNASGQNEQLREGENTNSKVEGKTEGDLDMQLVWGVMRSRRGRMVWTRWIQKETLRRENWKFGRRRDWGGLTRVEKIMVLEWG